MSVCLEIVKCPNYYGYCVPDCIYDDTADCPFFERDFEDDFDFVQLTIWEVC